MSTLDGTSVVLDVLHSIANGDAEAQPTVASVRTATGIVAALGGANELQAQLDEAAHVAYNQCIDQQLGSEGDVEPMRLNSHVRELCLVTINACHDGAALPDAELSSSAKHFARTGMQFVLTGDDDDAERCFAASARLLSNTLDPNSVEVLEVVLTLKGFEAQLHWSRGDIRALLHAVEEAHTILERRGAAQFLLVGSRRYLAEHVAFTLASKGFSLLQAHIKAGVSARDSADEGPPIARRDMIRLLDLSLALLGGDSHDGQDDTRLVRDKVLRLRAWLCLEDGEIDMATQSLRSHTSEASPEFMLLHCALLFRSGQREHAGATTLEWIRGDTGLAYEAASDAVQLLLENQSTSTALSAVNLLSERVLTQHALQGDEGRPSPEYSELQEVKLKLLTETLPDSAAAAEHIEAIIDGHSAGAMPLTEGTLRSVASRLLSEGCTHYAQGDLHRTVEGLERAYRFLEHTKDWISQHRAQATLAHCYLQQNALEKAVDRANNALVILVQHESGGGCGSRQAQSVGGHFE